MDETMSVEQARAYDTDVRTDRAGAGVHPANSTADPEAHKEASARWLEARRIIDANPVTPPAPTTPTKGTPRAPWLADKLARGAQVRHDDKRREYLTAAKTGTMTPDPIDYEAQQIIDAAYSGNPNHPGEYNWIARAHVDPQHPKRAEATMRVRNAFLARQGGDKVVLESGLSMEELAERVAAQAEAAANPAPVQFDETVENPRHEETGKQLPRALWEGLGHAAARESISTSNVQTAVAAFLGSRHLPDATDDALRSFYGKDRWKQEVAYAEPVLKLLYQWLPEDLRGDLLNDEGSHVPVPLWAALARAGRERAGVFKNVPAL